jgi:hypothetical protein
MEKSSARDEKAEFACGLGKENYDRLTRQGVKIGLKGCLHLSLDCEYSLTHKTRAG